MASPVEVHSTASTACPRHTSPPLLQMHSPELACPTQLQPAWLTSSNLAFTSRLAKLGQHLLMASGSWGRLDRAFPFDWSLFLSAS